MTEQPKPVVFCGPSGVGSEFSSFAMYVPAPSVWYIAWWHVGRIPIVCVAVRRSAVRWFTYSVALLLVFSAPLRSRLTPVDATG